MKTHLLSFILFLLLAFSVHADTYGQRVVACVLIGEAGIDGTNGMTAVAEVIRNRADERHVSLLAVVQRPSSFSCLKGVNLDQFCQKMMQRKDYPTALAIAKVAYNNPEKLPGITKGSTYFHATNALPYWARGVKPVVTIGRQHFYDRASVDSAPTP